MEHVGVGDLVVLHLSPTPNLCYPLTEHAALLRNGSKSVRWIFGSFLEELKKSKKRGAQDLFVLFAATERAHAAARRPQVHDGGQLSPWNHSN